MNYIIEEWYEDKWNFYTSKDELDECIRICFILKNKDNSRKFRIIKLEGGY